MCRTLEQVCRACVQPSPSGTIRCRGDRRLHALWITCSSVLGPLCQPPRSKSATLVAMFDRVMSQTRSTRGHEGFDGDSKTIECDISCNVEVKRCCTEVYIFRCSVCTWHVWVSVQPFFMMFHFSLRPACPQTEASSLLAVAVKKAGGFHDLHEREVDVRKECVPVQCRVF